MKHYFIKVSTEDVVTVHECGTEITLNEMQKHINGFIEYVYLENNLAFVVDEEGLLKGLEFNTLGTYYYNKGTKVNSAIVGDILLVKIRREETIGFTPDELQIILEKIKNDFDYLSLQIFVPSPALYNDYNMDEIEESNYDTDKNN